MTESMPEALAALELAEAAPGPSAELTPAPRRRRSLALRAAGFVALAGTLLWTCYDIHWPSFGQALSEARPGWLVLAAALNFTVLAFQAARWLALVRPLSPAATIGQAFKAMIVGFAVSTVVPARAGELARAEWFGRVTGLSRVSVAGSILLDHLVNAAGLLAGLAALPLLIGVPLWLRPGGYFTLALFVFGTMVVVALKPVSTLPDADPEPRSRLPLRTLTHLLARVRNGLLASRNPRALGYSLGASLVAWGLEINVTLLSMRAVGLHLPVAASILVLVAVNLALALPFAPPGNIGTLELGATLALLELGVPKEQALAFAVCYHLLQVVPIGILGFGLLSRGVSPMGRRFR